jgi:BirA family biotin operon repressor/biotin-[acetyl-CoA-carboxylase] ligase
LYKIPANTLFTGQKLVFVPECHSTNTTLMTMSSQLEEGAVLITANQTAGRGQRGNTWEVEPGANLTFSLLLKPRFLQATDQFSLTMVISLAVTDALKELEEELLFQIKWPNDILGNGKKICGILIENTIGQSAIHQCIAGMGININQGSFSISKATSLSILSGKKYDLNMALNKVLEKIEKRYLQLRNGKSADLKNDYMGRLFGKDEAHAYLFKENEVQGIIRGVEDSGKLLIEVLGEMQVLNNKEISYLY